MGPHVKDFGSVTNNPIGSVGREGQWFPDDKAKAIVMS